MHRHLLVIAAIIVMAPSTILAADPEENSAQERAAQHFEAGRRQVRADRCDLAVPEFQESLAASGSVGAWLNLGECQEMLGRLEEAYDAFRSAQALAAELRDDRLTVARASAERVESKALRVVVRPPSKTEGLSIELDGAHVAPIRWQTLLVRPDVAHRLVAHDAQGIVLTKEFAGRAGERIDVDVVRSVPSPASPVSRAPHGAGLRTTGYVTMGVGAATLVGAVVFGALTLSARSDVANAVRANPLCRGTYPDEVCEPAARAELDPLVDRADGRATATNVLCAVGIGGIVTGIVLVALAPSGKSDVVQAIVRPRGFGARFAW